jgi:hypothetical protein
MILPVDTVFQNLLHGGWVILKRIFDATRPSRSMESLNTSARPLSWTLEQMLEVLRVLEAVLSQWGVPNLSRLLARVCVSPSA